MIDQPVINRYAFHRFVMFETSINHR